MLEGTNEKPARAGGRIADKLPFLRIEHAHHEINDWTRGEELAELAAKRVPEEAFEGQTLNVITGLGKVEPLEFLHDAAKGFLGNLKPVGFGKQVIGLVIILS